MDCKRIVEILPWLLNGTLSAEEQQQARTHLAQCAECRRELQETAFAGAVHQRHISEQALVDYTFDRTALGPQRELIESHTARCAACAEQLALAEQSRRLLEAEESEVALQPPIHLIKDRPAKIDRAGTPRWPVRFWQTAAVAASLIGFVAVGGLWWSWQQTKSLRGALTEEQRARQEEVAKLEAENEELRQPQTPPGPAQPDQEQERQEIAQLQARIKELSTPQVNIPVLEVFPQELTERTERGRVNQLQIPRNARAVTLILNSQSASESKSYSLEIIDSGNSVVWSRQGVVRHSTGDYTVSVPTEFLPAGDHTFNVYGNVAGKRVKIESYRIHVRKQ